MANFLLTVFLSFIVILVALLVFRYISPPVYRVEAVNIKRLLESALNSDVTSADWDVFNRPQKSLNKIAYYLDRQLIDIELFLGRISSAMQAVGSKYADFLF